jgi:hypothetical protein
MAKVLKAEITTFLTGQFSESLQITIRAYNQFPAGVDVEDYTKRLVSYDLAEYIALLFTWQISMELLYRNFNGLASSDGGSVTGPKNIRTSSPRYSSILC